MAMATPPPPITTKKRLWCTSAPRLACELQVLTPCTSLDQAGARVAVRLTKG